MDYDVTLKEIAAQPTVVIRVDTTPDRIAEVFRDTLPEISAFIGSRGLSAVGPPFGRYFDFSKQRVDMESGIPVAAQAEGEGRIQGRELPGGRAVSTFHLGPYTNISGAYDALEEWIAEEGLESAGAPWEVYWSGPEQGADSSQWRTEIVWPVL